MRFLDLSAKDGSQWSVYRKLELIPESVPDPSGKPNYGISAFRLCWRKLLHLMIDELVEEERVEYLDRCWALDEFGQGEQSPTGSLQRLWMLMN